MLKPELEKTILLLSVSSIAEYIFPFFSENSLDEIINNSRVICKYFINDYMLSERTRKRTRNNRVSINSAKNDYFNFIKSHENPFLLNQFYRISTKIADESMLEKFDKKIYNDIKNISSDISDFSDKNEYINKYSILEEVVEINNFFEENLYQPYYDISQFIFELKYKLENYDSDEWDIMLANDKYFDEAYDGGYLVDIGLNLSTPEAINFFDTWRSCLRPAQYEKMRNIVLNEVSLIHKIDKGMIERLILPY